MTSAASQPVGSSPPPPATYRLLLFVAGDEPNSRLARENLAQLRAAFAAHDCEIKVIDVLADYRPALEHNVLVTPCLLWRDPDPPVRIVGNLSDLPRVRAALRLTSD